MKKIYRTGLSVTALCLLLNLHVMAQDETPAPPPARVETTDPATPLPSGENQEIATPPSPVAPLPDMLTDQSTGVIIRQKGKKSAKITVELNGGEVRVNGKPISAFRDKNVSVSRLQPGAFPFITTDDGDVSVFRDRAMNQSELDKLQLELKKQQRDIEVNVDHALRQRNMIIGQENKRRQMTMSNEAYLGVGSKKSDSDGALVVDISTGGPAEKAGLKKGDLIMKVNSKTVHNPDDLFQAIHEYKPGDKVTIIYKRDSKEMTVSALLEKSNAGGNYHYNYRFQAPEIREFHGWNQDDAEDEPKLGLKAQDNEDGKGVDVLDVISGSAAEKAGLKKGDNVRVFGGDEVNGAEELADKVRESRGKAKVAVSIVRDGKSMDLELHFPRKLKTEEL